MAVNITIISLILLVWPKTFLSDDLTAELKPFSDPAFPINRCIPF